VGKRIIQIPSADGCAYVYDADEKALRKICGVEKPEGIPEDALETMRMIGLSVKTE
jgi:hypothetical protein